MSPRPSKRNTDSARTAVEVKLNIERLEKVMEQRGLNRAALAEVTGLSRAAITYFLKGERQPSRPVLGELADKLSVTVDYLLGLSDLPDIADVMNNPRVRQLVELYRDLSWEEQVKCLEYVTDMISRRTVDNSDSDGNSNSGADNGDPSG